MHTQTFSTVKEVIIALKGIGVECQPATVVCISKHCRQRFIDLISAAITSCDDATRQKHVVSIKSLLSVATDEGLDLLRSVLAPMQFDEESIVGAASYLPVRFASALTASVSDDDAERRIAAKDYLRQTIETFRSNRVLTKTSETVSTPALGAGYAQRRRADPNSSKFRSAHAYGSSYALCFNATTWDNEVGVMLDAAVYTGSRYDWEDSIHIWLSPMEIGELLAVLRRWKPRAEITAHGNRNEKTFILEAQTKHFYGKVLVKSKSDSPARAVPITPKDASAISILLIEQLAAAYPNIPLQEVLATVSAAHSVYDAPDTRSHPVN